MLVPAFMLERVAAKTVSRGRVAADRIAIRQAAVSAFSPAGAPISCFSKGMAVGTLRHWQIFAAIAASWALMSVSAAQNHSPTTAAAMAEYKRCAIGNIQYFEGILEPAPAIAEQVLASCPSEENRLTESATQDLAGTNASPATLVAHEKVLIKTQVLETLSQREQRQR
jgi:hypothetical protein